MSDYDRKNLGLMAAGLFLMIGGLAALIMARTGEIERAVHSRCGSVPTLTTGGR